LDEYKFVAIENLII